MTNKTLIYTQELLESDTSMLAEEKERLIKEARHKEAMLAREKQEKHKLMSKIQAMESKLLTGKLLTHIKTCQIL